MKSKRDEITDQVFEVVAYVRGTAVKEPALTLDMQIVKDLRMGADTADLVLLLQEKTGIKPPKAAWERVRTIGDIVEILLKSRDLH